MKNKRLLSVMSAVCLVLLFVALPLLATSANGAQAPTQVINLKLNCFSPQRQGYAVPGYKGKFNGVDWWVNEINNRTGGRVNIKAFWSEGLHKGANSFEALNAGISDIAYFTGSMTPGRLPISADLIGDCPLLRGDLKLQLEVAHRLLSAGLLKEYDGYKLLMWTTVSPMVLFTKNKVIAKIEDFKGLKIRARGSISSKIVEAFGAVPIGTIDTGDLYMALERGTIDGLSTAWNTLGMTKIYEVLSYNVDYGLCGGCVPMIMTQRLWNSLPPDIQLIFQQTSLEAENNWIDQQWLENEISRKLFYDRGGKTGKLTPAEEARWDQKMQSVTDQIIAGYRAKGLPMDEILAIANLAKQEFRY